MKFIDASIVDPSGMPSMLIGEPNISNSDGVAKWLWDVNATHSGNIGKVAQAAEIRIRYESLAADHSPQTKELTVPLEFEVDMRDFPLPYYLGMLAIGVVVSYVFTEGEDIKNRMSHNIADIKRPMGWLVFSLILTPMVYLQFKQAVPGLTGEALLSLLLAIPFGAGLDFAMGNGKGGCAEVIDERPAPGRGRNEESARGHAANNRPLEH